MTDFTKILDKAKELEAKMKEKNVEDWLEIFKNADIEIIQMEDKLNFRLVQFILKF